MHRYYFIKSSNDIILKVDRGGVLNIENLEQNKITLKLFCEEFGLKFKDHIHVFLSKKKRRFLFKKKKFLIFREF